MKFAAYDRYIVTPDSRAEIQLGSLPGVTLSIAPLGAVSPAWVSFFTEWQLRRNVDLSKLSSAQDDAMVTEWAPALADHGIRGWTGLVGDDLLEVPYSAETARELLAWLADRCLLDLKKVYLTCSDLNNFRPAGAPELRTAEEAAKNS